MQSAIYKITPDVLENEYYFEEFLATNLSNEYYWSDDWSPEFYISLAKKGFISVSQDTKEGLILLPELQLHYGILDFKNLHISKKVQKLLKKDDVTLSFNVRFDEIVDQLNQQHKYNWLKGKYAYLMEKLYKEKKLYDNFEIISVALISKNTQELIAGEIGYKIGKTYTSLSGFSSKEKAYNNYGKLQLVLLGKYLQNEGFSFWNLGHPHMKYKQRLGSVSHSREEFLQRWNEATKHELL